MNLPKLQRIGYIQNNLNTIQPAYQSVSDGYEEECDEVKDDYQDRITPSSIPLGIGEEGWKTHCVRRVHSVLMGHAEIAINFADSTFQRLPRGVMSVKSGRKTK